MATTSLQAQRPWNTLQSVAGRPCKSGKPTSSSSCSEVVTTCKRSPRMWLMRTPLESTPNPYARSSVDSDDWRYTYARDAASCIPQPTVIDSSDSDMEGCDISSTRDIVECLVHFASSFPASLEDFEPEFDEFEDSDSETDVDSDSEAEAQYITIPPESPWWKPPQSSDSLSFDTLIDSDEDEQEKEDVSPSHSLSEILQQQQILVGVFHDELRRITPGHAYDDDWLREVDAKLLLAPVESFEEACKGSMRHSRSSSVDSVKPLPDVPIDFGDDEDDDESSEDWEWDYPAPSHRVSFIQPRPVIDQHFGIQKIH